MCDPYEDPITRPEILPSVSFNLPFINLLKARSPMWIAPVAAEFLPFLGYVAICWSFFEDAVERFLQALQEANQSTSRWSGRSFGEKRKVFKREVNACFKANPFVAIHLKQIVDDAVALQSKRNLLLHGHVTARVYTKWIEGEPSARPTIKASSQRKGINTTEEFDVAAVEDLYYALANLSGRINRFSHPIRHDHFPHFSLQDIFALQEFLTRHYRPLPEGSLSDDD